MALSNNGNHFLVEWQAKSGVGREDFHRIYSLLNRLPNADVVAKRALDERWSAEGFKKFLEKQFEQAQEPTFIPVGGPVSPLFSNDPIDGPGYAQPILAQGGFVTRANAKRQARAAKTNKNAKANKNAKNDQNGWNDQNNWNDKKESGGFLGKLADKVKAKFQGKKQEELPSGYSGYGAWDQGHQSGPEKGAEKAKPEKKSYTVLYVILTVLVLLAVVGGSMMYITANSSSVSTTSFNKQNSVIEKKDADTQKLLDMAIPSDFLQKPTSFSGFVNEMPVNWVLYFLGAPLMLFLVFRERVQAREFSDIRLASVGLIIMLFAVIFAGPIARQVALSGMAKESFFLIIVLTIGFLLNLVFQLGAALSGLKDYSVIALGVYVSGLLLNWWFHSDIINTSLGYVGVMLMLVGIFIQVLEIRRTGSFAASAFGAFLMLLFFAGTYSGLHVLIAGKLADPTFVGVAYKALKVFHVFLSALAGIGIAMVVGLVYGSIFLQPTAQGGRKLQDGSVDLSKLNILDSDSQALFVMVLFLLLPVIWALPFLIALL